MLYGTEFESMGPEKKTGNTIETCYMGRLPYLSLSTHISFANDEISQHRK